MDDLKKYGMTNIKQNIEDEKTIDTEPPKIVSSFVTFDYADEVTIYVTEETAQALMTELLEYKDRTGDYKGFWDERLKNEEQ